MARQQQVQQQDQQPTDTTPVDPVVSFQDWAATRRVPGWAQAVSGAEPRTASQWDVWFDALRQRTV